MTRISGKPYPESTVAAASERFNAGNDKLDARDYPGALADFRAAARLDPGFVKAVDMIAVSFRRLNQLDSAEHYYLKSILLMVFIAAFAKTSIEGEGRLAKDDLYEQSIQDVQA